MTGRRTPRSAACASTTCIPISTARTTAARPGGRSPTVCRTVRRSTPCGRTRCAADCCSPAPRAAFGPPFDDGDHWQSLQLNLPHTSMRDLWIHGEDLLLATHGRSFWILDDIAPLRQVSRAVEQSAAFLFTPAPAYRIARDTNTDTPLPPDEAAAQNPPDGAVIDYYLAQAATGPVSLEIRDARGALVRRYASNDRRASRTTSWRSNWSRFTGCATARNSPGAAGMHRWVWDLRYAAPLSTDRSYPIAAVPRANAACAVRTAGRAGRIHRSHDRQRSQLQRALARQDGSSRADLSRRARATVATREAARRDDVEQRRSGHASPLHRRAARKTRTASTRGDRRRRQGARQEDNRAVERRCAAAAGRGARDARRRQRSCERPVCGRHRSRCGPHRGRSRSRRQTRIAARERDAALARHSRHRCSRHCPGSCAA